MKTLTLLRHAKSGMDDPAVRDFDRTLNPRGQRAAATLGRHLLDKAIAFDHVVASPAARVTETLAQIGTTYNRAIDPAWDRRIYLASAATLLDIVNQLPDDCDHVLMAGHNPGLEDLVLMLVPEAADQPLRDLIEEKFPTASLAVMTFDTDGWSSIAPGDATLTAFVRPRDLDPTLGPDAD